MNNPILKNPAIRAAVILMGSGMLSWNRGERIKGRYGAVTLYKDYSHDGGDDTLTLAPIEPSCINPVPMGRRGTLLCLVTKVRHSGHMGDMAKGLTPQTPEVGEVVILGSGALFYDPTPDGGTAIGLKPDKPRECDWLDPRALYQVLDQSVELYFLPEEAGWPVTCEGEPDGYILVPPECVDSVVDAALAGGIGSWANVRLHRPAAVECTALSEVVARGGSLWIDEVEWPDGIHTEVAATHDLTIERVLLGLRLALTKGMATKENVRSNHDFDAGEAGDILQLGLFQEVIYG